MSKTQFAWTPHRDPYERHLDAFSVSYMSNAKWYKVFQAIANAQLGHTKATWKFIDSEHPVDWMVPGRHDLLPNRLVDGSFQPVEYKWIEWMFFPRSWRPGVDVGYEVSQDIERLKQVLEKIGQLETAVDDVGLTLFGYGRRQ